MGWLAPDLLPFCWGVLAFFLLQKMAVSVAVSVKKGLGGDLARMRSKESILGTIFFSGR